MEDFLLPERRAELLARRAELQERLCQEEAAASLRRSTAPLDEAGVEYALTDEASAISWIRHHIPITTWNCVDWAKVDGHQYVREDEVPSAAAWLESIAHEIGIEDPEIIVVYAAAHRPCLRMRFGELVRHVEQVIDWSWDNWIFDENGDWLIEYFHHGRWCWGRGR